MNELRVTALLQQLKNLLEDIESEIRNHPEHYKMSDSDYEQVKYYYEHESDDDGYPD